MKYDKIPEEEIKNRVVKDYFWFYDWASIVGKIDFCFTYHQMDIPLEKKFHILWADAPNGNTNLYTALVQLILTIGRARTFDKILTTKYLGAHTQFGNKYERPHKEIYRDYIVERRDLLVPQVIHKRKGSFLLLKFGLITLIPPTQKQEMLNKEQAQKKIKMVLQPKTQRKVRSYSLQTRTKVYEYGFLEL